MNEDKRLKPVVTEKTWTMVLERRAMAIYAVLKKREDKVRKAFEAKSKGFAKKLTVLKTRQIGAQRAANAIGDTFLELETKLFKAAEAAGVVEKGSFSVFTKRKREQTKILPYVFAPRSGLYNPSKSDRGIEGFLRVSKHQEYKDLLNEFNDLKLEIELADDEQSKALLKSFLAKPAPAL